MEKAENLVERLRQDHHPESLCSITGGRFRPTKVRATLIVERREAAHALTAAQAQIAELENKVRHLTKEIDRLAMHVVYAVLNKGI